MKLKLLSLKSLNDAKIYHNALEELSNNCPYYKLKFISAFSSGIENCYAFVLLDDNNSFECVMPIYLEAIKNKIDNVQYYDAKSVYGYSGPLFHEDVSEQTKEVFWSLLDQWYKEHNLVSEFIRFSLNDNYTGYSGYLNETLLNIKGKLTTPEILFNQYDRKVRKNINKAKRENVDVKVYSENIPNKIIDEFYD